MFIPQLGKYAESILENGSSSGRKLAKLQAIGRQAVAALCALGGFKETIKIGSEVQVSGRNSVNALLFHHRKNNDLTCCNISPQKINSDVFPLIPLFCRLWVKEFWAAWA